MVNLVSNNGEKVKTYRYDAFGVEKNMVDEDTNSFRYCGEYFDKETNTIYLRARYYDPTIGRFISRDTNTGKDTDPLSLNLYTYCRNNPVIFTDESGHVFNLAAAGVGALIGAAINVGVMAIGDAISGETHSTSEYVATAVSGAIGGLAAGFTLGGSVAMQVAGEVAIDAGLGAVSSIAEQAIVDKEVNWSEVGMSALSSGLSTGINIGARRAVSNITLFCMGGSASKGCFVAGTSVETIDGDKLIEDIQIGDLVLSSDPETGKTTYKEVVNTYIHVKDTLVYITIDGETIETTEEHPFWIEGNGWVNAKNLNNGDIVRDKNSNNLVIENVEIVKLPKNQYVAVYNFEVADYHTYFVSGNDILVHNECKGSQKSASILRERATEINDSMGQIQHDRGTTAVMRALDNDTGKEVFLVATNSSQKSTPKKLLNILNKNEIYIGGIGYAEEIIMKNKGSKYTIGYVDIVYPGKHIRNIHDKSNTYTVEGVNADLWHYIPVLAGRSICFPRSLETLKAVVSVFVETYNKFGIAKDSFRKHYGDKELPFSVVDYL